MAVLLLLHPLPLLGQTSGWSERFLVVASGTFQGTSTKFTDTLTFTELVEEGRVDSGYRIESGPSFDGLAAVRLIGNFGVGVGVSYFTRRDVAQVEAQIPHPFFFNRHRTVSGEIPARRTEVAGHLQAVYLQPITRAFYALLSVGPSRVTVDQTLVSRVAYTHEYPFDTATFQSADTSRARERANGFTVGADLTWRVWRAVGLGGGVRFIRAHVDLPSRGHDVTVDVGGTQVGGGVRLRF